MSSSSAENGNCGICSGSVAAGLGQAIFTAECSHTFHFPCIGNFFSYGNRFCPICHAQWNHIPFPMPVSNAPFFNRPFPYAPYLPSSLTFSPGPPPQQPLHPDEPFRFCDDEPLPADPASSSSPGGLQQVTIKAIPERQAIAASESVSLFSTLVGLKAPPLSDDANTSQRAAIDIVTVLDVSGSMMGRKLDLVKRAVRFVIDNLGASDRLSVVSFSDQATRLLPLQRMTESGCEDAKKAVNSLLAGGGTNIVEGLKKGARVLRERRYRNPVTSIIFLSDGNDTYNHRSFASFQGFSNSRNAPDYLHLLPDSIYPKYRGLELGQSETVPVHSFGFGSDHDPITMHAIADASGGTFSFIESYEMVQDAFAGCIGGLLSVVTQELRLKVRSASHGVEIKSIPSGRYASKISNQGSEGLVIMGDLYADEEKEFLIYLSIPALSNNKDEESERKSSLLDISCSYKDAVSKEMIQTESDLVEIRRPKCVSPQDMVINMEVDRQKNRLQAAEAIQQAQQMAETGNLAGATDLLGKKRTDILGSASAQAGDGLCMWLEAEMRETEKRMENLQIYQQSGRAFALSGMSSHDAQRATTRGKTVAGAAASLQSFGFSSSGSGFVASGASFGAYATPNMTNMVSQSQKLTKRGEDTIPKKK